MNEFFLDTLYAQFKIEDGILFVTYKYGLSITIDMAKEIVQNRIEFAGNTLYPIIVIDNGIRTIDKEARDFFSSEKGIGNISAAALVLKSDYSALLGNFFLKITQPAIPVKSFTNKKKH